MLQVLLTSNATLAAHLQSILAETRFSAAQVMAIASQTGLDILEVSRLLKASELLKAANERGRFTSSTIANLKSLASIAPDIPSTLAVFQSQNITGLPTGELLRLGAILKSELVNRPEASNASFLNLRLTDIATELVIRLIGDQHLTIPYPQLRAVARDLVILMDTSPNTQNFGWLKSQSLWDGLNQLQKDGLVDWVLARYRNEDTSVESSQTLSRRSLARSQDPGQQQGIFANTYHPSNEIMRQNIDRTLRDGLVSGRLRQIGVGAFAGVYEELDPATGKNTGKVYKVGFLSAQEMIGANLAASAGSKLTVDFSQSTIFLYQPRWPAPSLRYGVLATSRVPGQSLSQLIASGGKIARVDVVRGLARELASLHSLGRLHRDISERNTIVDTKTNEVTLIDFGDSIDLSHPRLREGNAQEREKLYKAYLAGDLFDAREIIRDLCETSGLSQQESTRLWTQFKQDYLNELKSRLISLHTSEDKALASVMWTQAELAFSVIN